MAVSPEALLISAVIRSGDMKTAHNHGINVDMMIAHPDEWEFVEKYHSKYGKVPARATFLQKFPDFNISKVDEVDPFCEEVKQEYARASLTELMDRSIDLLLTGKIDKALEGLGTDLLRIQAVVQDQQDDYDLAASWEQTYQEISERIERVKTMGRAGVPTGFGTLDLITGGLQPGWVTIVGARLGHGKTWTLVKMATEAALAGYSSMYYSLEQGRNQIAIRTHSMLSARLWHEPFRSLDLMRGMGFDLQDYKKFLSELDDLLPGRMVINDASRGRVGPMTIAAAIERDEPDVVFIDYMTLMKQQGDGGWLSVADLSASMQQIAQRYQVPIVMAAQNNRTAIGDDAPDPGTLGRSDAIGQDADLVLMVTKKTRSVRKLSVAKFRHGEDMQNFFVRWKPNTGDIEECSGDDASDLMERDKETD